MLGLEPPLSGSIKSLPAHPVASTSATNLRDFALPVQGIRALQNMEQIRGRSTSRLEESGWRD